MIITAQKFMLVIILAGLSHHFFIKALEVDFIVFIKENGSNLEEKMISITNFELPSLHFHGCYSSVLQSYCCYYFQSSTC